MEGVRQDEKEGREGGRERNKRREGRIGERKGETTKAEEEVVGEGRVVR